MKVVFATTLILGLAGTTGVKADEDHFQIIGMDDRGIVWILNTATGDLRYCRTSNIDEPPQCSPWTEE